MTESGDIVLLPLGDGRSVEIGVRRSSRARRILLHVGAYDGKVELVLPRGASAPDRRFPTGRPFRCSAGR